MQQALAIQQGFNPEMNETMNDSQDYWDIVDTERLNDGVILNLLNSDFYKGTQARKQELLDRYRREMEELDGSEQCDRDKIRFKFLGEIAQEAQQSIYFSQDENIGNRNMYYLNSAEIGSNLEPYQLMQEICQVQDQVLTQGNFKQTFHTPRILGFDVRYKKGQDSLQNFIDIGNGLIEIQFILSKRQERYGKYKGREEQRVIMWFDSVEYVPLINYLLFDGLAIQPFDKPRLSLNRSNLFLTEMSSKKTSNGKLYIRDCKGYFSTYISEGIIPSSYAYCHDERKIVKLIQRSYLIQSDPDMYLVKVLNENQKVGKYLFTQVPTKIWIVGQESSVKWPTIDQVFSRKITELEVQEDQETLFAIRLIRYIDQIQVTSIEIEQIKESINLNIKPKVETVRRVLGWLELNEEAESLFNTVLEGEKNLYHV